MEYLWAFLLLLGVYALTTILSGIVGIVIPMLYLFLGILLGSESVVIGVGGLLGNVLNVAIVNRYLKKSGAISNAPRIGLRASLGYIIGFLVAVILNYTHPSELKKINPGQLLLFSIALWLLISYVIKTKNPSVKNFTNSVESYKIVSKYPDDPKWATYLFFKNGKEGWNETIPNSFLAKDPKNDWTFVHMTKDDAISYAKSTFGNAEYIDS